MAEDKPWPKYVADFLIHIVGMKHLEKMPPAEQMRCLIYLHKTGDREDRKNIEMFIQQLKKDDTDGEGITSNPTIEKEGG